MTEKIRIKGKFVTANIYKKAQALVSDKFNSLEKSKCTLPGRRIVDFAYFGGKFDSGCESCGEIFRFKDFLKETKEGLCSIMYFECKACGNVTGIRTSETYNQSDEGKRKSSSVNVKCALDSVELQPLELEKRMHDGNTIEESKSDELYPVELDRKMNDTNDGNNSKVSRNVMQTPSGLDEVDCTKDVVDVTVSQDGSWSKRGKGMNSLSGWGHVIGLNTGKCLDYSARVKTCAKCNRHGPVREHDCRLNWAGSAKAMEEDILVQLHKNASSNGLHYSAVIGDEDCASIKHIREKVGNVEKYSDFGHLKRTLSNKMEDLHKNKNVKSLSRLDQFKIHRLV